MDVYRPNLCFLSESNKREIGMDWIRMFILISHLNSNPLIYWNVGFFSWYWVSVKSVCKGVALSFLPIFAKIWTTFREKSRKTQKRTSGLFAYLLTFVQERRKVSNMRIGLLHIILLNELCWLEWTGGKHTCVSTSLIALSSGLITSLWTASSILSLRDNLSNHSHLASGPFSKSNIW